MWRGQLVNFQHSLYIRKCLSVSITSPPEKSYFSSGSSPEVVTVDVKAAKHLLDSGHVYLDVRTVEEFKKAHVDADKICNIPYMFITPEGRVQNHEFLKEVKKVFNKEDYLIVGCQSGVRSLYATSDLLSAGFKHVTNMDGGHLAWMENGFPHKIGKEEEKQHDPEL